MENQVVLSVTPKLSIEVTPNNQYVFLMATAEVAKAYGISEATVRSHKFTHRDELVENTHFTSVDNTNAGRKVVQTLWTKEGVIKLGFFIRSKRAVEFREWATTVIAETLKRQEPTPRPKQIKFSQEKKANHKRLTAEMQLEMALDFAEVEPKELRMRLIDKYLR